jgi:Cu/Ag efflux protein CusF
VKVNETGNGAMRAKLGIPQQLGSCHTALVGGYAIEGHVPAADVRRLLRERPQAVGLAVPGMPVGAPGMDDPAYGGRRDPFDVLLVARSGETRVYASYNQAQAALAEAQVRKVDAVAGRITLKHGEIRNLDMPPMTMVFRVQDKALLAGVKAGDSVRFAAVQGAGGQLVVTRLEPRK